MGQERIEAIGYRMGPPGQIPHHQGRVTALAYMISAEMADESAAEE
jgi:hypothetical protein